MITRVTAAGAGGATTNAVYAKTTAALSGTRACLTRLLSGYALPSRLTAESARGNIALRIRSTGCRALRRARVTLASVEAALRRDCRAAAASSTIAVCSAIDVSAHAALIETLDIGIYKSAGALVSRAGEHATTEAVESTRRAIGLTLVIRVCVDRDCQANPRTRASQRFIAGHTRASTFGGTTDAIDTVARFADFIVLAGRAVVPRDDSGILTLGLSRRKLRRSRGLAAAARQAGKDKASQEHLKDEW